MRAKTFGRTLSAASEGDLTNGLCRLSEGLPVGDSAIGWVGLAGFADGGVETGPLLGLVLGFVQMADGTKGLIHMSYRTKQHVSSVSL